MPSSTNYQLKHSFPLRCQSCRIGRQKRSVRCVFRRRRLSLRRSRSRRRRFGEPVCAGREYRNQRADDRQRRRPRAPVGRHARTHQQIIQPTLLPQDSQSHHSGQCFGVVEGGRAFFVSGQRIFREHRQVALMIYRRFLHTWL